MVAPALASVAADVLVLGAAALAGPAVLVRAMRFDAR
jgi:hypothetical protein